MDYLDSLLHWFAMIFCKWFFFLRNCNLLLPFPFFTLALFSFYFIFRKSLWIDRLEALVPRLIRCTTAIFLFPKAAGHVPIYHAWNTAFLVDSSFGKESAFCFIAKLDIASPDHQKFSAMKMEPGQAISLHVVKVA